MRTILVLSMLVAGFWLFVAWLIGLSAIWQIVITWIAFCTAWFWLVICKVSGQADDLSAKIAAQQWEERSGMYTKVIK